MIDPDILVNAINFVIDLADIKPVRRRRVWNEAWDSVVHGIPRRTVPAKIVIEGLFTLRANVHGFG